MERSINKTAIADSGWLARFLTLEGVVAASVNITISGLIAWLKFHTMPVIPVWGAAGFLVNSLPSSLFPALLMTVGITLSVRRRRGKGKIGRYQGLQQTFLTTWLPGGLLTRSVVAALVATALSFIISLSAVCIFRFNELSLHDFMVTQILQGLVLGAVLGPMVALRAAHEQQ